jgi:hypothetical protein
MLHLNSSFWELLPVAFLEGEAMMKIGHRPPKKTARNGSFVTTPRGDPSWSCNLLMFGSILLLACHEKFSGGCVPGYRVSEAYKA